MTKLSIFGSVLLILGLIGSLALEGNNYSFFSGMLMGIGGIFILLGLKKKSRPSDNH